jgi:DNA polymerase I-like protein with 3'-5' exonuclease and polymerase domains
MLMQADAAALEIRVAAYLSQDETLIREIVEELDIHTDNQTRFGLPSRLIAKIFVFRLLYGGSAYSFANDPEFMTISKSEQFWQKVIDAYYEKYEGIKVWHTKFVREAVETGKVVSPTGREYIFQEYNGSLKDTQIKNYVVQGTGADLMALARVSFHNRLKKLNYIDCLLVNTVHDSIILDYNEKVCDTKILAQLFHDVFRDLPRNFEKLFLTPFNVPMTCEVLVGTNWENMEEIKCS